MQPEAVFTSDELTFIASKFVRKSLYSRATNSFFSREAFEPLQYVTGLLIYRRI